MGGGWGTRTPHSGKQVSAAEAVEARLARIEELNPTLNSVAIPLFDQARREAVRE